jgi:hypothetical protein
VTDSEYGSRLSPHLLGSRVVSGADLSIAERLKIKIQETGNDSLFKRMLRTGRTSLLPTCISSSVSPVARTLVLAASCLTTAEHAVRASN